MNPFSTQTVQEFSRILRLNREVPNDQLDANVAEILVSILYPVTDDAAMAIGGSMSYEDASSLIRTAAEERFGSRLIDMNEDLDSILQSVEGKRWMGIHGIRNSRLVRNQITYAELVNIVSTGVQDGDNLRRTREMELYDGSANVMAPTRIIDELEHEVQRALSNRSDRTDRDTNPLLPPIVGETASRVSLTLVCDDLQVTTHAKRQLSDRGIMETEVKAILRLPTMNWSLTMNQMVSQSSDINCILAGRFVLNGAPLRVVINMNVKVSDFEDFKKSLYYKSDSDDAETVKFFSLNPSPNPGDKWPPLPKGVSKYKWKDGRGIVTAIRLDRSTSVDEAKLVERLTTESWLNIAMYEAEDEQLLISRRLQRAPVLHQHTYAGNLHQYPDGAQPIRNPLSLALSKRYLQMQQRNRNSRLNSLVSRLSPDLYIVNDLSNDVLGMLRETLIKAVKIQISKQEGFEDVSESQLNNSLNRIFSGDASYPLRQVEETEYYSRKPSHEPRPNSKEVHTDVVIARWVLGYLGFYKTRGMNNSYETIVPLGRSRLYSQRVPFNHYVVSKENGGRGIVYIAYKLTDSEYDLPRRVRPATRKWVNIASQTGKTVSKWISTPHGMGDLRNAESNAQAFTFQVADTLPKGINEQVSIDAGEIRDFNNTQGGLAIYMGTRLRDTRQLTLGMLAAMSSKNIYGNYLFFSPSFSMIVSRPQSSPFDTKDTSFDTADVYEMIGTRASQLGMSLSSKPSNSDLAKNSPAVDRMGDYMTDRKSVV